eukprot:403360255
MLKQHQQQIIFNQNGVIIHNNYGQQNESRLQSNPNMSFQSVQDLENYCMELEIDRENQSRKISELEQWITCLSQSTLVAAGNQKEATSLQEQINYCLKRLDTTFKENFSLKKELAYEKKRFLDLLQAFNTLQVQAKQQENDKKDLTEKEQLIRERNQLQNTLQNLTAEVEFLSNKNEMFLRELKTKDFYSTYKDCVEELTRLREAHTILIGMIQNHHLDIGLRKDQSDGNDTKVQNQKATSNKDQDQTQQSSGKQTIYKNNKAQSLNRHAFTPKPFSSKIHNNNVSQGMSNTITTQNRRNSRFMINLNDQQLLNDPNAVVESRDRASSIQSFITCGTIGGNQNSGTGNNTQKPTPKKSRQELEDIKIFQEAILKNEYLQILRDPLFLQREDINFLKK